MCLVQHLDDEISSTIRKKTEDELLDVFKRINNAELEVDQAFNDNEVEIEDPAVFAVACFQFDLLVPDTEEDDEREHPGTPQLTNTLENMISMRVDSSEVQKLLTSSLRGDIPGQVS